MKTLAIVLAFVIFLFACGLGTWNPDDSTNNPGNLNTLDSNNPSQGINTAAAPTSKGPILTPVGDEPGPGRPHNHL